MLLLLVRYSLIELFLGLLKFVDLFLEHFNVQFELLFNFDMIAHFCFILLQLLFIFFGRQVE